MALRRFATVFAAGFPLPNYIAGRRVVVSSRAVAPAFTPCPPPHSWTRTTGRVLWYSNAPRSTCAYSFEEIKAISSNPSSGRVLVDVREPSEFRAGAIPGSINIPIVSAPDAFSLSEEDFEDRFGFAKPGVGKEVVFYCKAGIRSSAAAQLALRNGYERVAEYPGSWLDWEKRVGQEN